MFVKKLLPCFLLIVLMIAGCAQPAATEAATPAPATEAATEAATTAEPAAEEADPESEEALYQKALENGGKVVIYTASTSLTNKIKAAFEADYPGLTLDVLTLGVPEQMSKLIEEQAAGIFTPDLALIKENGGSIKKELVDTGHIVKYLPDDVAANMTAPFADSIGAPIFITLRSVAYNTAVHDTCPVTNWWDLTDPEWKGKVFICDPVSTGGPQLDFIIAFALNGDEMAAAYKEKYGEDVVLDGTENAGYEFLKRLYANTVFLSEQDDVAAAIAAATPEDDRIGTASSNDPPDFVENGQPVDVSLQMTPKLGVLNETFIFEAKNAPNPEGARLAIRYMLGGADGTGNGIEPIAIQEGSFLAVKSPLETQATKLADLNFFRYDSDAFYTNYVKVIDFLNTLPTGAQG